MLSSGLIARPAEVIILELAGKERILSKEFVYFGFDSLLTIVWWHGPHDNRECIFGDGVYLVDSDFGLDSPAHDLGTHKRRLLEVHHLIEYLEFDSILDIEVREYNRHGIALG